MCNVERPCPKVTEGILELSCTEVTYRRATTRLVDNKQIILLFER